MRRYVQCHQNKTTSWESKVDLLFELESRFVVKIAAREYFLFTELEFIERRRNLC